jgi:PAS domain S-box-containing protein
VLIDGHGFIAFVNKRAEELFEYERNELLGKQLTILIPQRFRDKHIGHRQKFMEKPQIRTMGVGSELLILRKKGAEVQVEITLNPIETSQGQMVLASIVDITERKIQEATQKRQMELEIRNKELEQFAYIASHDLQEPLRTISNYMQAFETDYWVLLDEEARKYIYSVNDATKRMSMLIKSLLDFARLGLHKKLVQADCTKLISDVIADLNVVIKKSGAIINVTGMPILNVYETEVRQVFQNLITNAIKFCAKNIHPKIQIHSEKINEGWKFSVRDNGIGIAPEHFKRVFDIFQRLHSDDQYEGSGIGLANCRKIIQLHQGEIWIESKHGEGTTFYFTIPNLSI